MPSHPGACARGAGRGRSDEPGEGVPVAACARAREPDRTTSHVPLRWPRRWQGLPRGGGAGRSDRRVPDSDLSPRTAGWAAMAVVCRALCGRPDRNRLWPFRDFGGRNLLARTPGDGTTRNRKRGASDGTDGEPRLASGGGARPRSRKPLSRFGRSQAGAANPSAEVAEHSVQSGAKSQPDHGDEPGRTVGPEADPAKRQQAGATGTRDGAPQWGDACDSRISESKQAGPGEPGITTPPPRTLIAAVQGSRNPREH